MINNGSHTFSKVISTNYQVLSLVPLKQCAGITLCLINLISAKLLKVWSVKLAKKYVKNFKWFLGDHIMYIFIYIYINLGHFLKINPFIEQILWDNIDFSNEIICMIY